MILSKECYLARSSHVSPSRYNFFWNLSWNLLFFKKSMWSMVITHRFICKSKALGFGVRNVTSTRHLKKQKRAYFVMGTMGWVKVNFPNIVESHVTYWVSSFYKKTHKQTNIIIANFVFVQLYIFKWNKWERAGVFNDLFIATASKGKFQTLNWFKE